MADESTEEDASEESRESSPDETSEGVFEEESEEASDEDKPTVAARAGACPVAPTGLVAEPGINEVRLTWSAGNLPKDDPRFADALAFYVSVTGPESRVLRTTDPTVTVAGLRNGVDYSFEVFAATAAGRSEPEGPVRATPTTGVEGVVAGLIVEFADEVDPQPGATDVPGQERVAEVDLAVAEQVTDDAVLVEFSEPVDLDTAEGIAADLAAAEQVEWAEPNQFLFTAAEDAITSPPVQTVSVPTDTQYATSQWNLWDTYGIGIGDGSTTMTDAWAGARGDGVTVAVIDTGVTAHPDLDTQLVSGYDFVSNPEQLLSSRRAKAPPVAFDGDYVDESTYGSLGRDANPMDPGDWREVSPVRPSSWHGTAIAGLIAAAANDDSVTGIAPNAKIQPIRALSWRGGLLSDIAASITWASGGSVDGAPANANPSRVINMSFAVEATCPRALQDAIDGARQRGSLLIAAAGNAGSDAGLFAPGNCNGVITVGASNRDGSRANYSNHGPAVDLSAPGGDGANPVASTGNDGLEGPGQPTTSRDFGTSIAAAHVSAAAAILASRNPGMTPDDLTAQLTGRGNTKPFAGSTCDSGNPDVVCGTGILTLAQVAAAGDTDTYVNLNGSNQRAIGASGYFPVQGGSGQSFTVSAWVYDQDLNSSTYRYVAAQQAGASSEAFYLGTRGGSQEIHLPAWDTGILLPQQQWVHLTVVRSGTNATLYVNGAVAAVKNNYDSGVNISGSQPFRVGSFVDDRSGEFWNGRIDQVKVYTSALSAAQVITDMESYGAPSGVTSLVAMYDFNDVSGSTIVNGGTLGASGNLTMANSPTYTDVASSSTSGTTTTVTFSRSYLTANGGWIAPSGVSTSTSLLVGGGGGGGHDGGGAGGGGGYFEGTVSLNAGAANAVIVGGGGTGRRGYNPANNCWDGNSTGGVGCPGNSGTGSKLGGTTVGGGGGGGGKNGNGAAGTSGTAASGSGGGGGSGDNSFVGVGGSGATSGGNGSGWRMGGGGGGASASGTAGLNLDYTPAGFGGNGVTSTLSGSSVMYGSGGSGGTWGCNFCIATAPSGAGTGGFGGTPAGFAGANTGGGGGGGGGDGTLGGFGGSGIVVVSYSTVPGVPTGATSTAGQQQVTLSWTAPTYTGGSAITGYTVQYAPVSGTWTNPSSGTCASATTSTSTTCSITGLTAGTTYTFQIRALNANGAGDWVQVSSAVPFGTLSTFAITTTGGGAIGTQVAGTSFAVRITAQDSAGGTVTSFTGTVDLTTTSLFDAGGGTTAAFTNGVLASHSVTLLRAGASQTLTATRTGGSETGSSSGFTITAGTATKLQVLVPGEAAAPGTGTGKTGTPTAVVSGSPITVTVNAVDANWNVVSAQTPTVALTSTDAAANLPANAALVSGTRAFSVTLRTDGSQTVTASTTPTSLTSATSEAMTVGRGPATALAMVTQPIGGASGSPLGTQPVVSIVDAGGSTVTTDSTTQVTVSASGGVLSGSTVVTAVNGVATFTGLAFNGMVGQNYTLTFTSSSLTSVTSANFTPSGPGPAQTLRVDNGSGQTATVGMAVATRPTVSVEDAEGNGIAGVSVTFAIASGGGSLASPTTVTTDGSGIATAPAWTLGTTAGSNSLSVTSVPTGSAAVTVSATGIAAAAATIAVNAGNGQSATAGSAVSTNPSVLVTDQYGNAKSGVSVTFSVQTGGGSLAASGTVTTNASGIATSPAWTLGTTAGSNTLRATSGSLGGSPVTFTATGTAGAATKVALTTSAAGAASGAAFTTQPVVAIQDANSNTRTSDSSSVITATVSSAGSLVGTSTATVANGVATFTDLGLSGITGSYTLTFSSGALTQATQSISLATGAASTLSITQQPSGAVYGAVLTTQPIVRLLDSGGNLVTTAGVLITASLGSGTGSLAGNAVVTNASGIATFTGLAITATPGPYTLSFTGPGLATVSSSNFPVRKADQATLTMSSAASALYGQTITLASTGGSGTGATVYAVDAGTCTIASGVLTLGDAASLCSVSATKVGDANYNAVSSASQTITIAKAGQTLTFTSTVPPSPLPTGTYTPRAAAISTVTGQASGVTPTFTASGTCSLAGGVVTFNSTGLCTVTSSAGSSVNFLAAADATQSILVGALNQNITFTQPGNVAFGSSSFGLSASASSDLPVSFALGAGTTNGACSVSALGVVTIVAVGTCEAVASQTGDGQYAAASPVTRAFQVVAALPTAPTLTSASASSQAITVGFTAPGFDGGVPITAYRLVATGGGTTVTSTACTASPCTISGLTNGVAYTVTVAAINSAGTGPASSATGSLTPATAAFAVGALAATPGNTTVTLTWTPLENAQLGGGTFTRYEISMRPAGTSTWNVVSTALTSQSADNLTIPGLNNGISNDFQVVAITSANASEIPGNTAQVVQYPSTVPSAPQSPTVLASTATDVQFSWAAPLSDGGATLTNPNYTVTVTTTAAGANTPITCNPGISGTNCLATGLSNGALYTFTVKANNRMGSSAGASVTYVVPSSDATLSNLVVTSPSGGVALSPLFASGNTAYVASVANAVSSVTVTPTTSDSGASVTVNGVAVASGSPSGSISLAVGSNTVTVLVTASDPRATQAYTIAITRQADPGEGGSSNGSGGLVAPTIPVVPPALVMNGGQVGGVLLGGSEEADVVWVRTSTNSGWEAMTPDFTLSVDTASRQRAPEPLLPSGAMQVPQGGFVVVDATGYAPQSTMAVFAIPRGEARVVGKVAASAMTNAIWLGSTVVGDGGSVSLTLSVPMTMDIGDYVLQINGESTQAQLRSVNMQLVVVPGSPVRTVGLVQRAGFYEGLTDEFTAEGERKLRSLVRALPKDAQAVQVQITGVSVSLADFESNLAMAGKRAAKLAKELKAAGVSGEYTVNVSATFTVDAAERSLADKADVLTTKTGKPLSTVTVLFQEPVSP